MNTNLGFLLIAIFPFCISSCAEPHAEGIEDTQVSEWIGKTVRVQFRRDALGAAAPLPVSPKTGEINGASTTLVGTLLEVNKASVVIEEGERPKWIPREVILFIEVNP